MFAPMMTVVAWKRDISPTLTKPTTMTVVADELWMMAVTPAPMPTPARRERPVFSNQRRSLLVASFSILSDKHLEAEQKGAQAGEQRDDGQRVVERAPIGAPPQTRPAWQQCS